MVIKKIFSGEIDEEVHSAFLKYGKGIYSNKYIIEAKKQKDKFVIKTSAEYVNFLVRKSLEGRGKIKLSGIIVSTIDLSNELPFPVLKTSNFQGVRKIQIDTEVDSRDIVNLIEKYPRFFYALSFRSDDIELKIKAKAPKSAKPGKDDKEIKADFCTLKTSNEEIVKEILFDVETFKESKINHTVEIEQIIYPKDSSLSPKEIRDQSKRKGKIMRTCLIDGKEKISQKDFIV